jgi:8-oxo-dGTP diphosphatase
VPAGRSETALVSGPGTRYDEAMTKRIVTAAVIEENGRVLIARRKKGDRCEGRWEFPGGKVEPGESPESSLERELREELGIEVAVGERLCAHPFRVGEAPMELLVYRTRIVKGEIVCHDHDEVRWIAPRELDAFDLTDPDRRVVESLYPHDGEPRR